MEYKFNLKQDEIHCFKIVQDHRTTTTKPQMRYDS